MFSDRTAGVTTADELGRIGDITVPIIAELDRTSLSFLDVARWSRGSLIRLPNSAGETISIYAGDVRIGAGEVLVVDGVLTIRVSDLVGMPDMPESAG
jgi:flagellar motor switch/type III secretory pathway protein FliN